MDNLTILSILACLLLPILFVYLRRKPHWIVSLLYALLGVFLFDSYIPKLVYTIKPILYILLFDCLFIFYDVIEKILPIKFSIEKNLSFFEFFKNLKPNLKRFFYEKWEYLKKLINTIIHKNSDKVEKIKNFNYKKFFIKTAVATFVILLIVSGYFFVKSKTLHVIRTSPYNLAYGRAIIKVYFNKEIKSIDEDKYLEHMIISPKIKGDYQITGNCLSYKLDEPLKPGSTYNVKVNTDYIESKGVLIKRGREFEISSYDFKLENISFDIQYNDQFNADLIARFKTNYPISNDEIKKNIIIRLKDSNKKFNYIIERSELSSRLYTLIVKDVKRDNKDYELEINKNLLCVNGTKPLGKTTIIEKRVKDINIVEINKELTIVDSKILNGENSNYIGIEFSDVVSTFDLKRTMKIEPEIDYEIIKEYRYILIKANFATNKRYTVTFDGTESIHKAKFDSKKELDFRIYDKKADWKFGDFGNIISRYGNHNIKVSTLNLDMFKVSAVKIYKNNLVHYLREGDVNHGNKQFTDYVSVDNPVLNKNHTTDVNLSSVFGGKFDGAYRIKLRSYSKIDGYDAPPYYYNYDDYESYGYYNDYDNNSSSDDYASETERFVCFTDIGIITKTNGSDLFVWTISLDTKEIKSNINLEIRSYNNQVLYTGKTDENGFCKIRNYKDLPNTEGESSYLLIASKNKDFSYIKLSKKYDISSSVFGYSSDSVKQHKTYIASERSVYRPGENANFFIIDRSYSESDWYKSINYYSKYMIYNPRNRIVDSGSFFTSQMNNIKYEIPYEAQTGNYKLKLVINDYYTKTYSFAVEEFIPQTIEVDIDNLKKDDLHYKFDLNSTYLFGGKAKDLLSKAKVNIYSATFQHKDYPGYTFFDNRKKKFYGKSIDLGEAKLNEDGQYTYEFDIPDDISPPSALKAFIYGEVNDVSGRAVSTSVSEYVYPYNYYIGIKPEKKLAKIGEKLKLSIIAITPEGEKIDLKSVPFQISRETFYTIFSDNKIKGSNRQSYLQVIKDGKLDIINGEAIYEIEIEKEGKYNFFLGKEKEAGTSISINTESGGAKEDESEINELTIISNKSTYKIGDICTLNFKSKSNGKLMVGIESDKLIKSKFIDIKNGNAKYSFKVTKEMFPNFFVSALAINDFSEEQVVYQASMYKIKRINLHKDESTIPVDIDFERKTDSYKGIHVNCKVPQQYANGKYVVMIVDEGALRVSDYKIKDPIEFFYGSKMLGIKSFANVHYLLPDFASNYAKKVGGDMASLDEMKDAAAKEHLNPVFAERVKVFSHFSGIIEPNQNGEFSFNIDDIGEFNGDVRVSVIGAVDNKFVKYEGNSKIADDVSIFTGMTRAFAPKDYAKIPVKVFNNLDSKKMIDIEVKTDGPIRLFSEKKLRKLIKSKSSETINVDIAGNEDIGVSHLIITATLDGKSYTKTIEFAVRPYTTREIKPRFNIINANNYKKIDIDEKYFDLNSKTEIRISTDKFVNALSSIDYLVNYPYGCTEQTVSAAFPMLYINKKMFENMGYRYNMISRIIQDSITKVSKRYNSKGVFYLWPNSSYSNQWVSVYAMHFLLEADRVGYKVSDTVLKNIKKYILTGSDKYKKYIDRTNSKTKYSFPLYYYYLKAYLGKPDYDYMENIKKDKLSNLTTTARLLLSLTYGLLGEDDKGKEILSPEFVKAIELSNKYYNSYDSFERNLSFYLMALVELDYDKSLIESNYNLLLDKLTSTRFNTQQAGYALMALSKARDYTKEINLSDIEVYTNKGKIGLFQDDFITIKLDYVPTYVKIENNNSVKAYTYVNTTGYRKDLKKLFEKKSNLKVKRFYYNEEGKEIELGNLKKGDIIIVKDLILASDKSTNLDDLIVVDIFPSFMEYEKMDYNELKGYKKIKTILDQSSKMSYIDIRDDRIVFVPQGSHWYYTYVYAVRITADGLYEVPPLYAELMYKPSFYAYSERPPLVKVLDYVDKKEDDE